MRWERSPRKSTVQSQNHCVQSEQKVPQTAKEPSTGLFYFLGSPFVYTSVFGDDFAASVDFRGSRAAITDPQNANSEVRSPSDKDTEEIAGKK